ncbi:MAG: NUDIX domain-containing protein [Nannocystis sp.]|nr:NUDIX domain-containing protein [Nannocystis sp.]
MEHASPTPPRLAATVVILRSPAEGGAPELLMLRRSSKSPFMPDAWVFPGGKVDAADGPAGSDLAFIAAARRECQEECSLVLETQELRWFDTWITPAGEPRRFHARFFLVEIAAGGGAEATADGHETQDGRWGTATALLERWRAGEIDLPPPTACTLLRLAEPSWRALLRCPREQVVPPILPKWVIEGERLVVVLPHDPLYAGLPGEGGPPCERLAGLPRRFVRDADGGVWRPIV